MSEPTNVIEITQADKVRAATNAPELAKLEFTLGDRTFPVTDLSYDDYLRFITHLTPLLEVMVGSMATLGGIKVPSPTTMITPGSILQYAGESLPELACIVCNQTDTRITPEEVKKWSQTSTPRGPFKLAEIVLKQIEQNKIISDFASFFGQMLPLVKAALNLNQ